MHAMEKKLVKSDYFVQHSRKAEGQRSGPRQVSC